MAVLPPSEFIRKPARNLPSQAFLGGTVDPYREEANKSMDDWINAYHRLNPVAKPTTAMTVRPPSKPTVPMPSMTVGHGSRGSLRGLRGGVGDSGVMDTGMAATPLNLPAYDYNRVEQLGQRLAAPAVSSLRRAVQTANAATYDNPNVKRMTLRDALAGYGQGLDSVMSGALRTGADIYSQDFNAQVGGAMQKQRVASTEAMQGRSIKSAEAMQHRQLSSQEREAQLNNEWRAWLATIG